jgi:hypothetical protein
VSPAQWRDSSLGCPERGIRYAQNLTSGSEVKLRQGERDHIVHVGGGRAVVCGSKSDPRLSAAPLISASLKAADAVRAALAARLRLDPGQVRIVSTRPSRSASACAAAPTEAKGAAFIVEAEAAARTFRYYADDARTVSCDDSARRDEPPRRRDPDN